MQRFLLVLDGSEQGWQAAYRAFHVTARLGAYLHVLVIDSVVNESLLAQRANQVKIGGHAAGISIETQLIKEFSLNTLRKNIKDIAGLFIPSGLIPDDKVAKQFLNALSCPLWIISTESEIRKMGVLVDDPDQSKNLISYSKSLSRRIKKPLTGFVIGNQLKAKSFGISTRWIPVVKMTWSEINTILNELEVDMLFLPYSLVNLINVLTVNCVIYP